jgi:hypothetical protein
MTEHAEDPVGQAGSKVVQYVSLATMAAEAIAQVRQQRAARQAATDERTVRALRAQQTAARAAARMQWSPVLDSRRRAGLSLADTGLAWAASQAWRPLDPEAQRASEQATERLRELRPDVMARYDRLTGSGLDEVEAMRRVAPFFDSPPARTGEHVRRVPLAAAAAPTAAHPASADGVEEAVDTSSSASRQHYIDTGQYLPVGAAAAPVPAASTQPSPARENTLAADDSAPARHDPRAGVREPQAQQQRVGGPLQQAAEGPVVDAMSRLSLSTLRTPPQLARDGFPEPLTGEVLAAGRIKPKPPEQTAPAAVRSAGLATAARAGRGTR